MTSRIVVLLLASIALSAQTPVSTAPLAPPVTPKREVTDDYFGTKIVDSYRWLEDLKSTEVSAWMKAQNDYTRSVLDQIPGRDKLRARIAELDDTGIRVADFSPTADTSSI